MKLIFKRKNLKLPPPPTNYSRIENLEIATKWRVPAKIQEKVDRLRLLTQPKEGHSQFRNKKPELPENLTV